MPCGLKMSAFGSPGVLGFKAPAVRDFRLRAIEALGLRV